MKIEAESVLVKSELEMEEKEENEAELQRRLDQTKRNAEFTSR